jgi:predicted lysophospholipase L1 biosynthesis ABC-type transport system permease subunit
LGLGPAASIGTREGLGLGAAGGGVAGATLASWTLVVVAVIATVTFGASIGGLLDRPHRYGWAADRALVAGAGYLTLSEDAARRVREEPGVEAVAIAAYGPVQLQDQAVSAMGVDASAEGLAVTLLDGRLPEGDDEVALAVGTARAMGVSIGDRIETSTEDVTVVGLAALPAIGLAGVSHPSMAQGAVLTPSGLTDRNGAAFAAVAFVDLSGDDVEAAAGRAREALAEGMQITDDAVASYDALLPAELVEVDPARSTASVLVVVLGLAAGVVLALALGASVRRRRPQLATLAALGFEDGDLRRSVRWQAAAVAATALVVGLPLGVVAGRLLWTAFAWQVGVVRTPEVPIPLLAVVAAGVAVVALAAGELPARAAARTRPAAALRPLA